MSTGSGVDNGPVVSMRRTLPLDFPDLWRQVTRPELISMWFEPCHAEPDGRYSLRFTEDSGQPYVKYATVLNCREGAYRFRLEDEGYPDSTVVVRAYRDGDRSVLELDHVDPPAELLDGYRTGWADYLDSLERHVT